MQKTAVARSASAAASFDGGTTSCLFCKSKIRERVSLDCNQHYLCKECLQRKAGENVTNMYVCPSCSTVPASSTAPIAVLVDHDNLLLEAQKLGGRDFERDENFRDHRVRIDYKKLGDFVERRQGRTVSGEIFASRAVYADKKRFSLVMKERSAHTGGQKEVDTEICVRIMELLAHSDSPSTIVLFSGDRDISPAIRRALEAGWIVEITMWAHNTAKDLQKLAQENDKCKFVPLDENFKDIVSYHFFASDFESLDEESTVVVTVKVSMFEENEKVYMTHPRWWNELEKVSKWPVQYKWLTSVSLSNPPSYVLNEPRLALVFRGLGRIKTEELLPKIQSFEEDIPHPKPCELYTKFQKRLERCRSRSLSATPSDTWSEFSSRRSTPRNNLRCCSGKNCEDGLKCGFYHNKDEKDYFTKRKGKGHPTRKTRLCSQHPCRLEKEKCDFAHKENKDGWCTVCHKTGHFRKPTCQKCSHPKHIPTQAASALKHLVPLQN